MDTERSRVYHRDRPITFVETPHAFPRPTLRASSTRVSREHVVPQEGGERTFSLQTTHVEADVCPGSSLLRQHLCLAVQPAVRGSVGRQPLFGLGGHAGNHAIHDVSVSGQGVDLWRPVAGRLPRHSVGDRETTRLGAGEEPGDGRVVDEPDRHRLALEVPRSQNTSGHVPRRGRGG